jgi:hypothetical protein
MPSPQVLPQHRKVDYKKRTGLAGGWKISSDYEYRLFVVRQNRPGDCPNDWHDV